MYYNFLYSSCIVACQVALMRKTLALMAFSCQSALMQKTLALMAFRCHLRKPCF